LGNATLRNFVLWLTLFLLTGCYAHYPADWPVTPAVQDDCSQLSGVYEPWGSGSRYAVPRLAPRLLQDWRRDLDEAQRVELRVRQGVMSVTVHSAETQIATREYEQGGGEYQCANGVIQMARVVTDGYGVRRESIALSRTTDGALVVEDRGEGLGFFFIPIAGSEYLRFEPYSVKTGETSKPAEDLVNCVVRGERVWTGRSNCD